MSRTAVVCGAGGWVPPTTITNDDLAHELDTSDEWIRSRTGIRERRVIDPGMATSTLAVEAGRRALVSASHDRIGADGAIHPVDAGAAVDAVIVATATPDRSCPATAPTVASRLGLAGVAAFDVAAVCSGFLYALSVGSALISGAGLGAVLVIGADAFSTILDPACRSTRAIFGDGAGAVVLRSGDREEPGALLGFDLGSDGNGTDLITVPSGGSEQRAAGTGSEILSPYFRMDGKPVFARAVRQLAASAGAVLDDLGWTAADLDLFVAHQANLRILRSCAERLQVPEHDVFVDLDRFGNTAGGSVPLALADAAASGRLDVGDNVLLAAFGGGLTWGSAALRWPDITVEPCSEPTSGEPTRTVGALATAS